MNSGWPGAPAELLFIAPRGAWPRRDPECCDEIIGKVRRHRLMNHLVPEHLEDVMRNGDASIVAFPAPDRKDDTARHACCLFQGREAAS